MSFIEAYCLIAIRRRVLSVVLLEESVTLSRLADTPTRRIGHVELGWVVGARTWSAPVPLVKPGFCIRLRVLLVEVPKNLGPTE
jgi:hypothetical protein